MEHSETWFGGYSVDTETDGIRVSVGIDVESVPLPAIKLRIESRRDERVGVEVHHDVPSDPGVDAVGFHPSFGAENWTVYAEGRLTWAGVLEPGETTTTLYGVWLTRSREIFGFLEAPTVGRIDRVGPEASVAPSDEGTANKRLIDDSLAESGPETLQEMIDGVRALVSADDATGEESATETGASDDESAIPEITVDAPERPGSPESALPADAADAADAADGIGTSDAVPGPGAVRAGAAGLSRPDGEEVAALDDGRTARGHALFVRVLLTDRATNAPALLQDLVTAMGVCGRRVVTREDGVRVDAVVDTDHDPRGLADALAARQSVVDVLVQGVDRSDTAETTEFDVLQRHVDTVSPDEIDAELGTDGGHGPGPSVAELVATPPAGDDGRRDSVFEPAGHGGRADVGRETVRALVTELEALRDRVVDLEDDVSELRVRNRRLEQLLQRERERSRDGDRREPRRR